MDSGKDRLAFRSPGCTGAIIEQYLQGDPNDPVGERKPVAEEKLLETKTMTSVSNITKTVLRFLLVWGIDALSLLVPPRLFRVTSSVEPLSPLIVRDTFPAALLP